MPQRRRPRLRWVIEERGMSLESFWFVLIAFLWGIALANLLHGVPLNSSHGFAGTFLDLFSGYTVFAGLTVVCLFAFHGATYLNLRTVGDLCERAGAMARRLSLPAVTLAIAFVVWSVIVAHDRTTRAILPPAVPAALTPGVML